MLRINEYFYKNLLVYLIHAQLTVFLFSIFLSQVLLYLTDPYFIINAYQYKFLFQK